MIEPVVLPDGEAVDLPGIVPRLSETPGRTAWIGPPLGAHVGGRARGGWASTAGALEALRKERVI